MSYLLFLGFKASIYKTPPVVRVSLDNVFLDEFLVDKINAFPLSQEESQNALLLLYNKEFLDQKKLDSSLSPIKMYKKYKKKHNSVLRNDINLQILEINEDIINANHEHNLVIEIFNNDNNYTNGFLTKSTMITCNVITLIPKDILINLDQFLNEFDSNIQKYRNTHYDIDIIKKYYKEKSDQFDILNYNNKKKILKWYSNLNNRMEERETHEWIGEEGYFKFFFKNDLIKHSLDSMINYTLQNDHLLCSLRNKYMEYENKRDIN